MVNYSDYILNGNYRDVHNAAFSKESILHPEIRKRFKIAFCGLIYFQVSPSMFDVISV